MIFVAQPLDISDYHTLFLSVGCRDDNTILRALIRKTNGLDKWRETNPDTNLENMTCTSFMESEIWREEALQPIQGRGDNWNSYCKSIYLEFFNADIDTFPCGETCGFCDGKWIPSISGSYL